MISTCSKCGTWEQKHSAVAPKLPSDVGEGREVGGGGKNGVAYKKKKKKRKVMGREGGDVCSQQAKR